jgi:uncharacterized protein YprB with RNaseH-like and TPR domain
MLQYSRQLDRPMPRLPAGALPAGRVAYLDIETTGLDSSTEQLGVVGIAWASARGRHLTQLVVAEPDDEAVVLEALRVGLAPFAGVVSYNGNGFDLPFLRGRARALGISWPWVENFDLLRVVWAWNRKHRVLQNCRLSTVLQHFGIARIDQTDGQAVADAYWRWVEERDEGDIELVLDHNAEDVLLMPDLVPRLRVPAGRGA